MFQPNSLVTASAEQPSAEPLKLGEFTFLWASFAAVTELASSTALPVRAGNGDVRDECAPAKSAVWLGGFPEAIAHGRHSSSDEQSGRGRDQAGMESEEGMAEVPSSVRPVWPKPAINERYRDVATVVLDEAITPETGATSLGCSFEQSPCRAEPLTRHI